RRESLRPPGRREGLVRVERGCWRVLRTMPRRHPCQHSPHRSSPFAEGRGVPTTAGCARPGARRPPQPGRFGYRRGARRGARGGGGAGGASLAREPGANLYRAVTGQIIDISPQVIVIGDEAGERRFVLTADATAWGGGPLDPASLNRGDEAVIRLLPSRPGVA